MKFQYAKNIESDEPIMLLNKHIGMDAEDGMGIDGSLFQEELLALDQMGKKRIQIWINSVGGVVMDGYNICNAILKSNTRVDTYCLGMAASIAGVIFQTGRKRVMADYGILMYHNPYAGETTQSPLLDSMKDSLNTIISQRSGMNASEVHKMMDRTSFIQASEAKALGLCDDVEGTVHVNTKNFPKEVRAFAKEANNVLNKILDKTNFPIMLKVTNKLQLNDDANEDSIVKAIDVVVNKAVEDATAVLHKKSKEDLDKMKNDMDQAEDKFKTQKDAYDKATADLTEATDKIKVIEDKVAEEKAKNMVEGYVKMGKIKNEAKVIIDWTAKAKVDMDGTKALLESIPSNAKSEKIKVVNSENIVVGNPIAIAMAKIQNKLEKK